MAASMAAPTAETLEKTTLRKVYLRLVPFCFLLYILCYIDRINVSFAALTMNQDIGLSAYIYGLAAGAFFWGYCLLEVPSNLILEKVGARIWITRIMVSWGLLSAATASSGVAASRISSSRIPSAGVAAASATGIASPTLAVLVLIESTGGLAALEVDGVDDGVGSLGGLDGGGERLLAAAVDAVGEDDDGLSSGLLAHQLVGGEEEGVVEGGRGTARASGTVAGVGA